MVYIWPIIHYYSSIYFKKNILTIIQMKSQIIVIKQVQNWIGVHHNPCEWGFKLQHNRLLPIHMLKPAAPNFLMKLIYCGCKTDCARSSCSCRKYQLKCGLMCRPCNGFCTNGEQLNEVDIEEQKSMHKKTFLQSNTNHNAM